MLPNINNIASTLSRATVFSKLDATSDFYQIPLEKESCLRKTFITPFGISSAPEIFHRHMPELVDDLEGLETIIDDIFVYEKTKPEHDERLKIVLEQIRQTGIRISEDKCKLGKNRIEYIWTEQRTSTDVTRIT